MGLSSVQKAMLLKRAHQRETYLHEMQEILSSAKKENRSFTTEEDAKFAELEKQVKSVDDELEKHNTNLEELIEQMDDLEQRFQATMKPQKKVEKVETRSENSLEVRGFRGKERIGEENPNVQIGDLIYSHITGKFRNKEVRAALSTTSGGLVIPQNVYSDFIDKLRDTSILKEVTTYAMDSKTLAIPKVVSDIVPAFKLENELITESTPVFDSVKLEAKPLYALCPISLELIESSNLDMGIVITNLMASAMGAAMQNFMLNGAVNGYAGVLNEGYSFSGDVNYAKIGEALQYVKYYNGVPSALVMNAADATKLQLLTDTTGQYINPPEFMNGLRKYELSNAIPEGTALVGDLSAIAFGILSEGGLQIEVSRTAGEAFQRGQVLVRARINGDFAVTNSTLLAKIIPTA